MRLMDILRTDLSISSRLVRQLKKNKGVTVNNHKISLSANMRLGDVITIKLPEEENIFNPEEIPVNILYEDSSILVVNKDPFMVVHPTQGHPYGTLANGLAQYMLNQGDSYKIRFANRLDRDTSGAMVVCKSGLAQKIISDQMQDQSIVKQYVAIVEGIVEGNKGTINEPIDRAYEDSVHRIVRADGQPSVTHYEVLERFKEHTFVRITLETGRTHQIRVHMKHLGHTIVGDELYGSTHEFINRQALHSVYLEFKTVTGDIKCVDAPLLADMNDLLERLRKA